MSNRTESLWSPDIQPEIASPREILEAQARALGQQTACMLTAEVRVVRDEEGKRLELFFEMVAPALGASRHRLLSVRLEMERIYPCAIEAAAIPSLTIAHSDGEFRELVRQILQSGEVKSLALSLIARVREKSPSTPTQQRKDKGHARFRRAWAGLDPIGDDLYEAIEALYDEPQGID